MTGCRRGDVVLVRFVFADESGAKLRPAVIVSSAAYHRGRHEVIVAAITSNVGRARVGDFTLVDWEAAGLISPSTVTGILRTIKASMIDRKIGVLSPRDLAACDAELRESLSV